MTGSDLAAYIGAAAWLPIVIAWGYRTFVRPRVTIVPGEVPEIGFTTFGPIINIRMAITTARKPAIIDSLGFVLVHEDGSTRTFHWAGMTEDLSQVVDTAGNRQRIEKEQTAIAFHVGIESLLEKFVRFQDRSFHERLQRVLDPYSEKIHFQLKQKQFTAANLINSKEFDELERAWAREFTWKPGRYTGRFFVGSPSRVVLKKAIFTFSLADTDIEVLKRNLEINRDYALGILTQLENGTTPSLLQWNWRYPRITKQRN